jgi:anti-sigma factor RsiW
MVCESWHRQLDSYVDGELTPKGMELFSVHLRHCQLCAAVTVARMQMRHKVQSSAKRFTPSADFRRRVQNSITGRPQSYFIQTRRTLAAALIAATILVSIGMHVGLHRSHQRGQEAYSELADMHVSTLASSSQVDVFSSDRHTVKPWFEGRIPFSFELPDLQDPDFSLLGGRIVYLQQTPGAHLIYKIRKHEVSVFIFQEPALRTKWSEEYSVTNTLSFNMETWTENGLRYCVLGDTTAADIKELSELLKAAGRSLS